ncbi:hypothetical protein HG530_009892 [Fusarium avenaceum]|nr:hypothetical protein HG530_009892 [Fusarium avenaceum]
MDSIGRGAGVSPFGTPHGPGAHAALSSSWRVGSPLAEAALAADLAECSDDEFDDNAIDDDVSVSDLQGDPIMYRRPSGVAFGGSRPIMNPQTYDEPGLTALERKQSRNAERSLLRDNHVLPPKHGYRRRDGPFTRIYRRLFSTKIPQDEEGTPAGTAPPPGETDPLLGSQTDDSVTEHLNDAWENAVAEHRIKTTWQREAKTIVTYSVPLIVTFLLQYSINVTSIFAVGRIGKLELGAVSLANMTAAITCLAPFQGLATSLDTLCAQAYGSGHKHLVGLQFQRMTCFLFVLGFPVALLWWFSEGIIRAIVPEPESARLAGMYLRVMIFSIPGFILFEGGKRFTQAQGLFRATTYVLLIVAPFNVFLSWLLVWKLQWGFIGAPTAVAISTNLLPIFLFLYVRFVNGRQCWGGFSRRALSNWWIMIRLALPGMIMVEAEWLAFEILTLLSSRFGPEYLAAQSVVTTITTLSYEIPFPMSIAASTRIANLIGAGLVEPAKMTGAVAFVAACVIGMFNLTIYTTLRYQLPLLFTKDEDVIKLVAAVMPIVSVMQVFDGLAAGAHGLLRGIGKQSIGGPANIIAYYALSLPCSLILAFGFDWKLSGLWVGVTLGTITVASIEYIYLFRTDWHKAADEARIRNAAVHVPLGLNGLGVHVRVQAKRNACSDLGAEEHGFLKAILGPLAQVRRQRRSLNACGGLAVEVMSRSGASSLGGGLRRADHVVTGGASSGGCSGGLKERIHAACGQLVWRAGERARWCLGASAGRRSHVRGQLGGEYGGCRRGDEVASIKSLEDVLPEAAKTSTVTDEDEVVPAGWSHIHIIDTLDGAINSADNTVDLASLGELESLQADLNISTDALWSLLGRLGCRLNFRLRLGCGLELYRLCWFLAFYWLGSFCRRRGRVFSCWGLSSIGLALRLGSLRCAIGTIGSILDILLLLRWWRNIFLDNLLVEKDVHAIIVCVTGAFFTILKICDFGHLDQASGEGLASADFPICLGCTNIHVIHDSPVVDCRNVDLLEADVDHSHVGPLQAILRSDSAVDYA